MTAAQRAKERALKARTFYIAERRTTMRLEAPFLLALREVAARHKTTMKDLLTTISKENVNLSLSSAVRVYVMSYYKALCEKYETHLDMEDRN